MPELTAELIASLDAPADVRLSPDGSRAAWVAARRRRPASALVAGRWPHPREGHSVEERTHVTDMMRRVRDWFVSRLIT